MTEEKQHKRRIHYSGKYPRHFAEKYKELNPEKYGEEVAHVLAKGNTPAGMHIPIMVEEILEVLAIKPGEQGFDATLGYGGHTTAMLEKLSGQGRLFSGDIDPIESKKTEARIRAKGYGPE
ncbi:MAG: 16S rRNA (cytosine(1402)-N(4))-methyltransferase, partial [Selenomonas sp.]|nr:16S rRNA (cytosine(1402)-N(4))-methyltransferase [Selenomonas sp.]